LRCGMNTRSATEKRAMGNRVRIQFEIDPGREARNAVIELDNLIDQTGRTASATQGRINTAMQVFAGNVLANFFLRGLSAVREWGSESITQFNQVKSAALGLSSVAAFKGIDSDAAQAAVRSLGIVKSGIVTVGEATLGLKNLLSSGFGLEQSITLLQRLGDTAAFDRQASLTLGYAITSATEGIKNQNSVLVDNAGITKNLSVILKERGFAMEDISDKVKGAAAREALYSGLMAESAAQAGNSAKLTGTLSGAMARLDAQEKSLLATIGELIDSNPTLKAGISEVTEEIGALATEIATKGTPLNQFVSDVVSGFGEMVHIGADVLRFLKDYEAEITTIIKLGAVAGAAGLVGRFLPAGAGAEMAIAGAGVASGAAGASGGASGLLELLAASQAGNGDKLAMKLYKGTGFIEQAEKNLDLLDKFETAAKSVGKVEQAAEAGAKGLSLMEKAGAGVKGMLNSIGVHPALLALAALAAGAAYLTQLDREDSEKKLATAEGTANAGLVGGLEKRKQDLEKLLAIQRQIDQETDDRQAKDKNYWDTAPEARAVWDHEPTKDDARRELFTEKYQGSEDDFKHQVEVARRSIAQLEEVKALQKQLATFKAGQFSDFQSADYAARVASNGKSENVTAFEQYIRQREAELQKSGALGMAGLSNDALSKDLSKFLSTDMIEQFHAADEQVKKFAKSLREELGGAFNSLSDQLVTNPIAKMIVSAEEKLDALQVKFSYLPNAIWRDFDALSQRVISLAAFKEFDVSGASKIPKLRGDAAELERNHQYELGNQRTRNDLMTQADEFERRLNRQRPLTDKEIFSRQLAAIDHAPGLTSQERDTAFLDLIKGKSFDDLSRLSETRNGLSERAASAFRRQAGRVGTDPAMDAIREQVAGLLALLPGRARSGSIDQFGNQVDYALAFDADSQAKRDAVREALLAATAVDPTKLDATLRGERKDALLEQARREGERRQDAETQAADEKALREKLTKALDDWRAAIGTHALIEIVNRSGGAANVRTGSSLPASGGQQ
jgi:hypothetical protein